MQTASGLNFLNRNGVLMAETINVLAIGDVVREAGCEFLKAKLPEYKKIHNIDLCIVNGENSGKADGVSSASSDAIFSAGADILTGGDHSCKRRDAYAYMEKTEMLLRPYNIAKDAPGRGYAIVDKGSFKVGVINLMGRVFMDTFENPFASADEIIEKLKKETPIILVDIHAEATSEKKALGYYLDGRVSAVFGTHTHVQTSDAQILRRGTGYITDIGMTGPEESVLGIDKEIIIKKFTNGFTDMFKAADTDCFFQGCKFTIDKKTGVCTDIEAVTVR